MVLLLVAGALALVTRDRPAGNGAVATAAELNAASSSTGSTSTPSEPTSAASPSTAATEPTTEAPTTAAPSTSAPPASGTAKPASEKPPPSTVPATLLPPLTLPPLLAPPTTAAPAPAPAPPTGGIAPYLGLGTWVDVYDWSMQYSHGAPTVLLGEIDQMADAGVQTLFIQASKHDSPTDILEPELLQSYINKAKGRGLRVVAWYLPTLVDTDADLRRLKAVAGLGNIDGIAVDIEARNVGDIAERNRRLIQLSGAFRQAMPGRTIGGIVLPPVALEVINPAYWPAFPYREIAPFFDVWMVMGYWTNRTSASGYRDANRYTKENVDRLRNNLGQPDAPVHPIGGIGHHTTAADIEGYKAAVTAVHGIGGSIYDWDTTLPSLWESLRAMRLR